jgi:hypothetical protein
MIRRVRAAVLACGLASGLLLGVVAAGHAASQNPVDDLLDRARAALEQHEFSGTVRVTWWDGSGAHRRDVPVVAEDGALKVAGGELIGDDGRTWMRTGATWTTLWSRPSDARAPGLGTKYSAATVSGPTVDGRGTRMLVLRRDGVIAETVVVDTATGIVLRRELFDSGRPTLRTEFVSITGIGPRSGSFSPPVVGKDAPRPASDAGAPRRIAGGYALVGAQEVKGDRQLQYSDGVFDASVFSDDGELDWSALPAGGRDARLGDVKVRAYRTAEGSVLAWQANGRTWTCITNAPRLDRAAIVAALSRSEDDTWSQVSRFLTAPFRWV